jgi:uncharacterized membrane protein
MPDILAAFVVFCLIACCMFVKGFTRTLFCAIFIGFVLWYVILPGLLDIFR